MSPHRAPSNSDSSDFMNRLNFTVLVLLVAWISFFPRPVLNRYHLVTKLALAAAMALIIFWRRKPVVTFRDWPLWIFTAGLALNLVVAQYRIVAFRAFTDLSVPALLIYYLVATAPANRKVFGRLSAFICIAGSLVALLGLVEFLFKWNPIYEHLLENPYYRSYIVSPFRPRPMSTQFNPAALGGYLLGCLPFCLYLYRTTAIRWRVLSGLAMLLQSIVLLLTFSRGAFLGLVVICVFYLLARRSFKSAVLFTVIVLLVVLVSSIPKSPLKRFGIHWMGKGGVASTYRVNRCVAAVRMFHEYPFTGIGLRHYRYHFHDYMPEEPFTPGESMIADNMYATLLAETGLAGTIGFCLLVYFLLSSARRKYRRLALHPTRRTQLLVTTMALVGFLVNMAGYELFYWPNQYLFFCLAIGLLAALIREPVSEAAVSPTIPET